MHTCMLVYIFFFSSRRRHTRLQGDWSSDVCSSDLGEIVIRGKAGPDVGARMRRGLVVVTGDGGRGTGRGMIAGTVVVFGTAGPGAGRFLKRGCILALGAVECPATVPHRCTYRPPAGPGLLRYLGAR